MMGTNVVSAQRMNMSMVANEVSNNSAHANSFAFQKQTIRYERKREAMLEQQR